MEFIEQFFLWIGMVPFQVERLLVEQKIEVCGGLFLLRGKLPFVFFDVGDYAVFLICVWSFGVGDSDLQNGGVVAVCSNYLLQLAINRVPRGVPFG